MTNEEFVHERYAMAEVKDLAGWTGYFNPDGVSVDEPVGVTYRDPSEVAMPVEDYGYPSGRMILRQLGVRGISMARCSSPRPCSR